jgi:DNA-binding LacI/PurR family transcriptional regulator
MRQRDYFNMFREICIGGAVFHHLAVTKEQVDELREAGIQCVLLDNEYDIEGVSCINTDNYSGGRMAAGLLPPFLGSFREVAKRHEGIE